MSSSDFARQLDHVATLDGLRGAAVLMVILFHTLAFNPDTQLGGASRLLNDVRLSLWTGVDMFFVLSGFLITRQLLVADSRNYFRAFYVKRFFRLTPPYICLLVPVLLGGLWIGDLQTSGPIFAPFVYLQNYWQAAGPQRYPGLGHTWSLAIEEQFYMFWPLLIWLVRRRGLRVILSALAAVSLVSTGARIGLLQTGVVDPWAARHLTPLRLEGFTVGAIAAVLAVYRPTSIRWAGATVRAALALGGSLVALVIGWRSVGSADSANGFSAGVGFTLITIAAVALLVIALNAEAGTSTSNRLVRRLLGNASLRALGGISYAVYLVHWPIAKVLMSRPSALRTGSFDRGFNTSAIDAIVTLALTATLSIVASIAIRRFVERPAGAARKRTLNAMSTT